MSLQKGLQDWLCMFFAPLLSDPSEFGGVRLLRLERPAVRLPCRPDLTHGRSRHDMIDMTRSWPIGSWQALTMNCSCLGGLGESHLTILCAEGEHVEETDEVPPYEDRLGPDGWDIKIHRIYRRIGKANLWCYKIYGFSRSQSLLWMKPK